MTVSAVQYLKELNNASVNMGAKVISSDFTFEIEGFEHAYLLCKQAPWPVLSSGGEVEISQAMGSMTWQPQQLKTAQQGPITMMETVAGTVDKLFLDLLTSGGTFNATVYEGTPTKFLRAKRLRSCFLVLDNPDRDWENRAQILLFQGTLFYSYYGEVISGNSIGYR
jgi:hypothetical protein